MISATSKAPRPGSRCKGPGIPSIRSEWSTAERQRRNIMRVGILGSGLMGGKLGTIFARAGHEVVFSYARHKAKLEGLARDAGGNARAGTPGEAAREAEALLLAV